MIISAAINVVASAGRTPPMNDFTKEELQYIQNYIFKGAASIRHDKLLELDSKIQSMIDNYCEHEPADLIELGAAKIHDAYLETCKKLGWEVKTQNLVPYSELSEQSKALDRASFRAAMLVIENRRN